MAKRHRHTYWCSKDHRHHKPAVKQVAVQPSVVEPHRALFEITIDPPDLSKPAEIVMKIALVFGGLMFLIYLVLLTWPAFFVVLGVVGLALVCRYLQTFDRPRTYERAASKIHELD